MVILDTDVLIDFQRNYPPALQWFQSLSEIPMVPGFVVMELIKDARHRKELEQSLKLAAPLNIIWPTQLECNEALQYFAAYHLSHRLGMIDAFIAAMAVKRGCPLCTFNRKHYRPVTGLTVLQPYPKK